jgi:hypothetical protein
MKKRLQRLIKLINYYRYEILIHVLLMHIVIGSIFFLCDGILNSNSHGYVYVVLAITSFLIWVNFDLEKGEQNGHS